MVAIKLNCLLPFLPALAFGSRAWRVVDGPSRVSCVSPNRRRLSRVSGRVSQRSEYSCRTSSGADLSGWDLLSPGSRKWGRFPDSIVFVSEPTVQ